MLIKKKYICCKLYIVSCCEKTFNALMAKGYDQAARGDSYPIDDVFEELER